MRRVIGVILPRLGVLSQTFIRRHVQDLPVRAVVAGHRPEPHWAAACPVATLDATTYPQRLLARLGLRDPATARVRRAVRFMHQHGVAVVLGEFLDFVLPFVEPAERAGIRFFAHAHGYDVSMCLRDPATQSLYRQVLNSATGTVTMSQYSRAKLMALGLPPHRIHVVPYGVDAAPQPPTRLASHQVRCLVVGRMVAKKGPLRTLEAFALAQARIPTLHLDFAGDGELRPQVDEFVRSRGLAERVTLHGALPHEQVKALMARADVFLQHSVVDPLTGDEEGLPVAILEAMAHGLPVIATRHAGIPEAVAHGQTGLLVAEHDVAAMADCVISLAADADQRRAMGLRGWEVARQRFSWEVERAALLNVMGLGEHA